MRRPGREAVGSAVRRSGVLQVLAVSALLLIATVLLGTSTRVPTRLLTRDPTAALGGAPYVGFLSQVGIFFWAGAAAVCLLAWRLVGREAAEGDRARGFFAAGGMLTLLLGVDDLFLLHETVFPGVGIPEPSVYAAYGAGLALFLARYRASVGITAPVLMALALASFGTSAAFDVLEPRGVNQYLLEDGAKLVGIVSWLGFFLRAAEAEIPRALARRREGSPPESSHGALDLPTAGVP